MIKSDEKKCSQCGQVRKIAYGFTGDICLDCYRKNEAILDQAIEDDKKEIEEFKKEERKWNMEKYKKRRKKRRI